MLESKIMVVTLNKPTADDDVGPVFVTHVNVFNAHFDYSQLIDAEFIVDYRELSEDVNKCLNIFSINVDKDARLSYHPYVPSKLQTNDID